MPKAPGISRRGLLSQWTGARGSPNVTVYPTQVDPEDGDIMVLTLGHFGSAADTGVGVDGDNRGFRNDGGYYPSSTTDMTVMFWLKFDSNQTTQWRDIWDFAPDGWGTQPAWWIGSFENTSAPTPKSPQLELYVTSDYSGPDDGYVDTGVLTLNRWYHFAYVKDGDQHTFYQDGAAIGSFTLDVPAVTDWSSISNSLLGAPTGQQGDWNIARFRQWDVALTAAEVNAEMNAQTAVKTAGLWREIKLESVSGTDISGNGRDMTVVNGGGMTAPSGPGITPVWATGLTGWTVISQTASGRYRQELYWKRVVTPEPNVTATVGGSSYTTTGILAVYSGMVPTGSPVNVVSAATNTRTDIPDSSSLDQLLPSIATTDPNELVFIAYGTPYGTGSTATYLGTCHSSSTRVHVEPDDPTLLNYYRAKAASAGGGYTGGSAVYDGIKIWPGETGGICGSTTVIPYIITAVSFLPDTTTETANTRYYLTYDRPQFMQLGTLKGGWAHTWDSPRAYETGYGLGTFYQLSQLKAGGGRLQLGQITTDQEDGRVMFTALMTPRLAAQTIDCSFDLTLAGSCTASDVTGFGNAGPTPNSTCAWAIHMYVTQGDSLDVRTTLVDQWVDTVVWNETLYSADWKQLDVFRHLSAPIDIGPYAIQEGDRLVIEIGVKVVADEPYPPDVYEPVNYQDIYINRGVHVPIDSNFTYHNSMVPGEDAELGETYNERVPYLEFTQTIAEQAPSGTVPTNITPETATVITTLPYTSGDLDTSLIDRPGRPVWFTWTAPSNMRVYVTAFGSDAALDMFVLEADQLYVNRDGPANLLMYSDSHALGRSQAVTAFDAVADQTYYIYAYTQPNNAMSPRAGGITCINLFEEIPLADNDIIVGWIYLVRYTSAGEIAAIRWGPSVASGLAIDYSELPVYNTNDPGTPHTGHRLICADFSSPALYLYDLATLNQGEYNLTYIGEVFTGYETAGQYELRSQANYPGPPSETDAVFHMSAVAARSDGRLFIGHFGEGFAAIADSYHSYQNEIAEWTTGKVVSTNVQHGDEETGAPWPAATFHDVELEAGGSNYIELNPEGTELWYTSGGWYTPVGGQQIKRWDVVNDVQLPDFVTVPVGPGPNPGLKGIFPLPKTPTTPNGGVLVCNGGEVRQYDENANFVRAYVPSPSQHAQSLVDIELQSDGAAFDVLDEATMWLTQFDMATGTQNWSIPTWLGSGSVTSIVVYRAEAYPTVEHGVIGSGGIIFGGYGGSGFVPITGYEIIGGGGIVFGGRSPFELLPTGERRVWPCPIDEQIGGGCPPTECLSPCLSPDVVRLDLLE